MQCGRMEVGLSSRSTSSRDLKAAIVERVRAKTLAQLQAQQQQQQERDRLLSLASEHGRSGSSFWSPGPTAPSYDDDDDGESTKCSALVKRVPVLLLIFASCSIVLALIAKWVPVGITSVLASSVAVPPAAGSAPEVLPDFPPPAPEPSPPPPPKQLCSVLFDGDHCKKQKTLPKCMDTTFHGHMTLGNWIDGDLGDDQYLYEDVISLMPEEVGHATLPPLPCTQASRLTLCLHPHRTCSAAGLDLRRSCRPAPSFPTELCSRGRGWGNLSTRTRTFCA